MKLATLCYVRQSGKTLMIHRNKKENDMHAGKWNGLGGKLLPGETPEACAVREVREECDLTISNPIMKGVLTFPSFNGEDWYVWLFVAAAFSGELKESNEGHLAWINDNELFNLNLWEGDRVFLPLLDGDRFFSGKFIYRDGKLVDHRIILH